jgi:hypothetical protein
MAKSHIVGTLEHGRTDGLDAADPSERSFTFAARSPGYESMRNDDPTRTIGNVTPTASHLSGENVLGRVESFVGKTFTGGILVGERQPRERHRSVGVRK